MDTKLRVVFDNDPAPSAVSTVVAIFMLLTS